MTHRTDFNPARVHRGVPAAGRFAKKVSTPGGELPPRPTVDASFVQNRLSAQPRYEGTSPEMVEEITDRLNLTLNFSDEHLEQVADEVWLRNRGVTPSEEEGFSEAMERIREADPGAWESINAYLQAKSDFVDGNTFTPPEPPMGMEHDRSAPASAGMPPAVSSAADGISAPVPSSDPRLQSGEVFDRIMVKGREYRRAGSEGAEPWDTQGIRLQASRPLTELESYTIAGILGHANREAIGGEPLGAPGAAPERDTPYSFLAPIDTNKGRRKDYEMFEKLIPEIIANGTAVRKTDRSGPGTAGTRKIEPLGDPDLKVTLYYQM